MSIKLNLNKNLKIGNTVVLNNKKRGTILFDKCNGDKEFLIEDEIGNIIFLSSSDLKGYYIKGDFYYIINRIAEYLVEGDIIKFKHLRSESRITDILESIIHIKKIILENDDKYRILYDYGYNVTRGGKTLKFINDDNDYTNNLYLWGVREISFASQEEINILNSL